MQYVLYILLVAAIFGLVALCDFILKKLFKRGRSTDKAVKMPRYYRRISKVKDKNASIITAGINE